MMPTTAMSRMIIRIRNKIIPAIIYMYLISERKLLSVTSSSATLDPSNMEVVGAIVVVADVVDIVEVADIEVVIRMGSAKVEVVVDTVVDWGLEESVDVWDRTVLVVLVASGVKDRVVELTNIALVISEALLNKMLGLELGSGII